MRIIMILHMNIYVEKVERQVPEPVVQAELIKEMAQRNANEACRRVILSLPLEPAPSVAKMIEACTRKAELFSAPERNPGQAQPKFIAAVTPGLKKQAVPPQQLQHITCFQCKKTRHAGDCPNNQKQKKTNKQKKLGVQRVPAINTITRKDINTAGSTREKASLFKTKGEDRTNGVGIQDNLNVKCSINKVMAFGILRHLVFKAINGLIPSTSVVNHIEMETLKQSNSPTICKWWERS
ncbi:hypothetical protein TURU_007290 [Turdus rufiventris]|nr:hypothetical protein TURU_007290 [Turdus rufiventris]